MTDYFASARGRAVFLAKVDAYAKRYAGEPAIFGWELWNEINASRQGGYEEWTRDMLPELKRRFPRHLAMQSLGSYDGERADELYRRFAPMPGNEIAQAHRYVDEGAAYAVCHGPLDALAADAVSRMLAYAPGKPALLSEVGAVEPKHAGPFKLYAADKEGALLHDGLFAPFFAGSAGPGHFWHWQDYIEPNDLWRHYARFTEAIKGFDPRADKYEPRRMDQPGVRVYALVGERETLAWVRDAASDWKSELRDGKPPAALRGVRIPWRAKQARVYDPWANRWQRAELRDGYAMLPEFRRSVVVR
jgi:hypothetical protein